MRHQRLAAPSASDQESRQSSSGLFTRSMPKKSVDEAAGQQQTAREAPVQESGFRANLAAVPVQQASAEGVQAVGNPAVVPMQLQGNGEREENRTGMPDRLKSGLEQMSGMDLSAVRVHYNSAKPAQLNAHAYAQGTDIHLAAGQAQHLPHEAWHVVQQMQGRVRPTMQVGGAAVNDDVALEREADQMGGRATRG